MQTATTNQVRQILMNELGLTRDEIRKQMMVIVGETVDKAVAKMVNDKTIETIVRAEVSRLAGSSGYGRSRIAEICESVAKDQIAELIRKRLRFTAE